MKAIHKNKMYKKQIERVNTTPLTFLHMVKSISKCFGFDSKVFVSIVT